MAVTDRTSGYRATLAYKAPCKASSSTNITLSGAQTIDSVAVVDGDRVLVRGQTVGHENGIYVVSSGVWSRAADWNSNEDVVTGTQVFVHSGGGEAGRYEVSTADPILVGKTDITFQAISVDQPVTIDDFAGDTFTERMESAIAAINAGDGITVYIPSSPTPYTITSQLSAITGNNWAFIGDGYGTRINLDSAIGTVGTFFRFGDLTTTTNRGRISGMFLTCENTPTSGEYALEYFNCVSVHCEFLFFSNVAGVASFGAGATSARRSSLKGIEGNYNSGDDVDGHLLFTYGSALRISDMTMTSGNAASRTGALIKIDVAAGFDVDTVYFTNVSNQSFSVDQSGTPDGKPIGLEIDCSGGTVVNIYAKQGFVADHTTDKGCYIHGDGEVTNVSIMRSRFSTDSGQCIVVDNEGTDAFRDILIDTPLCIADDDSVPIQIEESSTGSYFDCVLAGAQISEINDSNSKASGIELNADGWTIRDNRTEARGATAAAFVTGLNISKTDLARTLVHNNNFAHVSGSLGITHPSYSGVSPLRSFKDNLGPHGWEFEPAPTIASAATVDLATTAAMHVTISGTATITSLGTNAPIHTEKVLTFSGAATLEHSATLVLPGALDYTCSAGDILRAIRTSAGWEISGVVEAGVSGAGRAISHLDGASDKMIIYNTANAVQRTDLIDSGWTTLPSSFVSWTGSSAPSSAVALEVRYQHTHNQVNASVIGTYGVAGTGVEAVTVTLPSSIFPTPDDPTGVSTADFIGSASGFLSTGVVATTAPTPNATHPYLAKDGSGGYELNIDASSGAYLSFYGSFHYFTTQVAAVAGIEPATFWSKTRCSTN